MLLCTMVLCCRKFSYPRVHLLQWLFVGSIPAEIYGEMMQQYGTPTVGYLHFQLLSRRLAFLASFQICTSLVVCSNVNLLTFIIRMTFNGGARYCV